LIGVQPLNLENYGARVTPSVRAQIHHAVAETLAFLAGQGVVVKPRPPGLQVEPLGPLSVGLAAYEAGCFA
jgi:hypothetical protein